jgi:putative aldouronate transport system substrate-binding protein
LYYPLLDSSDVTRFGPEAFNTWNMRVTEFMLTSPNDIKRDEMFAKYDIIAAKNKYPGINIGEGFQFINDEINAEGTALGNLDTQYLLPLRLGFVDDVEGAVADFLNKAEAAGLQKCRDAWMEQWLAYCSEFGYK